MSRRLGDDRTNVVQPIHPGHQRTLRFEAHVALLQMRIAGRNVGWIADDQLEALAGQLGKPVASREADVA